MLILFGLFLVLIELLVGLDTGFDLVLLGTILIIGGFGGLAAGNVMVALIISVVLSVVYILFGRSFVKSRVFILTHSTNIDKLKGKTAVVVRSITPDTAGLIRVDDEDWRATADQVLYEKEKVRVQSVEGVTLKVEKIKN